MFYRPVLVMLFTSTSLLLIAAVVLVVTSWRSLERHDALAAQLNLLSEFESEVQRQSKSADAPSSPVQAARAGMESALAELDAKRHDSASDLARRFANTFTSGPEGYGDIAALLQILSAEERFEWWLSLGMTLALPTVGGLIGWTFRRRIMVPLHNLGYLMGLLAERDYSTALTQNIDPYLKPLFDRYNLMVKRLIEFEKEHEEREQNLQQDVRAAARTMLQQQFALANSERLAATGELASQLAHDLRNPLAGIQAAVDNLVVDVDDEDHRERLTLVSAELKRVTKLLNELLRGSQQAPEKATSLRLAEIVTSTLNLASYQLSDGVKLTNAIAKDLECTVPESGLRRSLLNLILNAGKAIGETTGEVRVDAELKDGRLRLTVRDDGPGFSDEALTSGARAFTTWRGGGTGLGLTTVRRFAEDLGGKVLLENREPHGALVTLELPARGNND